MVLIVNVAMHVPRNRFLEVVILLVSLGSMSCKARLDSSSTRSIANFPRRPPLSLVRPKPHDVLDARIEGAEVIASGISGARSYPSIYRRTPGTLRYRKIRSSHPLKRARENALALPYAWISYTYTTRLETPSARRPISVIEARRAGRRSLVTLGEISDEQTHRCGDAFASDALVLKTISRRDG